MFFTKYLKECSFFVYFLFSSLLMTKKFYRTAIIIIKFASSSEANKLE